MDSISSIDQIYESMPISKSLLCCDSTEEMSYLIEKLQLKSYPVKFASSCTPEVFDKYPNMMVLTMTKEFNSRGFLELFKNINFDSIIFVGFSTFSQCLQQLGKWDYSSRQFIFTI